MVPYFQVGQHIRSTITLDAITQFLGTLPNIYGSLAGIMTREPCHNYRSPLDTLGSLPGSLIQEPLTERSRDKRPLPISVGDLTNKRTRVRVLSVNNIDTLHDYLANFLLSMPFQTRKKVDFLY